MGSVKVALLSLRRHKDEGARKEDPNWLIQLQRKRENWIRMPKKAPELWRFLTDASPGKNSISIK